MHTLADDLNHDYEVYGPSSIMKLDLYLIYECNIAQCYQLPPATILFGVEDLRVKKAISHFQY